MEKVTTSDDLVHMWLDKKLEQEDIQTKLLELAKDYKHIFGINLYISDYIQVARCIHHIYQHYHKWSHPGSFLRALASDSFSQIVDHADEHNLRAIYLYRLYLKNCAPGDWRRKLRGE